LPRSTDKHAPPSLTTRPAHRFGQPAQVLDKARSFQLDRLPASCYSSDGDVTTTNTAEGGCDDRPLAPIFRRGAAAAAAPPPQRPPQRPATAPKAKKQQRAPSAYQLWCKAERPKLVQPSSSSSSSFFSGTATTTTAASAGTLSFGDASRELGTPDTLWGRDGLGSVSTVARARRLRTTHDGVCLVAG
jgi:hypothetical protein